MNKKDFDRVVINFSNEIFSDTNTEILFEQSKELVTFLKTKELTVRQARLLLKLTSDFLLDEKLV